jgi:hypothetical protein
MSELLDSGSRPVQDLTRKMNCGTFSCGRDEGRMKSGLMVKITGSITIIILLFATVFMLPSSGNTQDGVFELRTFIALGETYDDNIFLTPFNEESDYITTISPGISLDRVTQTSDLMFQYAPTFTFYARGTRENRIRHDGTLSYIQGVTEHLNFNLSDTYILSDEPAEEIGEEGDSIESARRGGEAYQRNNFRTSLNYQFGPEDILSCGYSNSLLIDDNPNVTDRMSHNPFANITYRLGMRNVLTVDYGYTKLVYSNDEVTTVNDLFDGHDVTSRYMRLFSTHTSVSFAYRYTRRDFEISIRDYQIHDWFIGLDHAFSEHWDISVGGGSSHTLRKDLPSESDPLADFSLSKRFERGSFNFNVRGGWDERYLAADATGLTRFASTNADLSYQLAERVNSRVNIGYRWNQDVIGRKWENYSGRCGLGWPILRWLSLYLDYYYTQRNDDIETANYSRNQVMLRLTASHLHKWE